MFNKKGKCIALSYLRFDFTVISILSIVWPIAHMMQNIFFEFCSFVYDKCVCVFCNKVQHLHLHGRLFVLTDILTVKRFLVGSF